MNNKYLNYYSSLRYQASGKRNTISMRKKRDSKTVYARMLKQEPPDQEESDFVYALASHLTILMSLALTLCLI